MRTAEDYQAQLMALMPRGDAITTELDTDLGNLLLSLGDEFARVDARMQQLIEEVDPSTTTELITEWERAVGLPDCNPLGPTLGARRSEVVRRLTQKATLTKAFLESELLALGYTVVITEFECFEVGFSEVGHTADGPELATPGAWWFIDVETDDLVLFEAELGAFTVGEPLGAVTAGTIVCVLDRLIPAHLNYRLFPPP